MTRELASALMIQGTASSVGKSLLVAGLGRCLARRGLAVAPFKAHNLALNADVTPAGKEIGRAQALQARACMQLAHVDMNPILLKPEPAGMQVVLLGESRGSLAALPDADTQLRATVTTALDRLRRRCDVVILEGAGSPVELNLRDRDLANMFVARAADAPVLLVGDIERGGVFAQLIGTLQLLDAGDRARIAGMLVNKFHGDPSLFASGVTKLEELAGIPVHGVIPFVEGLRLADEDWQASGWSRRRRPASASELDVAIIALPFASNVDDFDALAWEQGVLTRFVDHPRELDGADLVIIPGTKATLSDLAWLRVKGFEQPLQARAREGGAILGICGGCQLLGRAIHDIDGVEAEPGTRAEGLGLLAIETHFEAPKRTLRVEVRSNDASSALGRFEGARGYWIHAGRVRSLGGTPSVEARGAPTEPWQPDGALGAGAVLGTMVHGLLANEGPRRNLLTVVARRAGRSWTPGASVPSVDDELDRLADAVERAVDMRAIDDLVFGHA